MPISGGALTRSVQRGTVLRTNDSEITFTETISSIDISKSFISVSIIHNTVGNSHNTDQTGHAPSKLTSSTAITFYFVANSTDRTFEYEIVEFY